MSYLRIKAHGTPCGLDKSFSLCYHYGTLSRGVAQLVERPSPKRNVASSSLATPAKTPELSKFRSFILSI